MKFAVSDLRFFYDRNEVLKNVSFEVEEGEVLGILGPNGVGKTTLLKILAGLLKPAEGAILLDGKNLFEQKRGRIAKEISFVPQGEEIFLPFTVEQIVLMGRAPYLGLAGFEKKEDIEAADEAMRIADLTELRRRSIRELSGGEAQRVFLARALAQQAPVLLLDEPTSHLDIRYQTELLELVASLNRSRGITTVMTLHEINLASLYCRKILLLKEGRLFAIGRPVDVITAEHLKEVYGTELQVSLNPKTGIPYFLPERKN